MNDDPEMIYDCPSCGQGGLLLVDILASPRFEAVVCQECDRVWISPKLVGVTNEDGYVEEVLPKFGAPGDWSSIAHNSEGVPWRRIDPEYQKILMRTRSSVGGKNA